MTTTILKPSAALALVAAIGLIGTGCGSDAPSETGTPAASGSGSAGSTSAGTTARDKAVKFSACMRANGVPEFPDPDASGQLTIDGVVNGSSLDPSAPAWKEAISACKDLQPSGFTGHKRSSAQQSAALRFADCIRRNGVEDFPDPAVGDPLVDTRRIPSTDEPGGMTILNAAMQKCRSRAAEAMGR